MRILIIGDIYGKVGRKMIQYYLTEIKKQHEIDFVIANGENVSHGKSITEKHYYQLKEWGINIITTGNHIISREETFAKMVNNELPDLLLPLNYNPYYPKKGTILINHLTKDNKLKKIRITNLIGRNFIPKVDNPFYAMDQLLLNAETSDIHIVDFHAEATAEKIALATYLDGQITCLVGTHTHVQTADNRILSNNTAFITDIGMTGPFYSIIGAEIESTILRERTNMGGRLTPATGLGQISAVVLTIDEETNIATSLERIFLTKLESKVAEHDLNTYQ